MQPTLGLIDEAAPVVAMGAAPEVALDFGPEISPGLPAFRSVVLSVLFHGVVIAALMIVRFPVAVPPQPAEQALSPTEIRIGQHVYYVAKISGSPPDAPRQQAKRTQASQRRAAAAPAIRNPKLVEPPAPAPPAPRSLPRAFIPPEVRPRPTARQTLIQPLSPPDLQPPVTPLPSFRILSPQIPKLAKPFLAPGQPKPRPVQLPVLNPPVPMELVHADPQPTNLRPRLALPRTPPPLDAPPVLNAPDLPPPIPVGDPANILSLNDRNIPMTDRLVVPPGNIAQPSGEGAGAGAAAGSSAVDQTNPRASGASSAGSNSGSSNNISASNALESSSAAGAGSQAGSPAGSTQGTAPSGARSGAASGAASSGSGTTTIASSASGSGVPGVPGANAAGGVTVLGGAGPRAPRAAPGPVVITRSPTGNFDAMVVQTTAISQYPESRGLLSGRPIYSVYIPVGTASDWTLYFCIPGEKSAPSPDAAVIQLGPPAAPVKAPYPTRLVRPDIALPSWEKYVLVHGYVNEQGRFEGLRVIRSVQPGIDQALLASLTGWEFRAATKDGAAVMVEFLLSIPAKGL